MTLKSKLFYISLFIIILLSGCSRNVNMLTTYRELDSLLESNKSILAYDLRDFDDCQKGHIKGFMCIVPLGDNKSPQEQVIYNLTNKYSSYSKSQIVVLICSDGKMSKEVAEELNKKGFKNIYYYEGGYEAYVDCKGDKYIPEVGCGC